MQSIDHMLASKIAHNIDHFELLEILAPEFSHAERLCLVKCVEPISNKNFLVKMFAFLFQIGNGEKHNTKHLMGCDDLDKKLCVCDQHL